jgi:hypothetical protein
MPTATYAYVTLYQALSDLGQRLYDTTQQMWSAAELTAYIQDALRTWNALTSFYRDSMTVTLSPNKIWCDLPSQKNSLRPYTATDQSQIQLIEYALLEPITSSYPLVWAGSLQFAIADILANWTAKQNEVLGTTGCTLTPTVVSAPTSWQRIFPPDTTLVIRRVAWIPVAGQGYSTTALRQSDGWAKVAYDRNYTTAAPAPPRSWMQSTQPPPSFDVDRLPPVTGQYEMLLSLSGPNSSSTAASTCAVPDDWVWVARWGALASLLGHESNASDPLRADYAEKRFQQGMVLMSDASAVLDLRINNIPRFLDGVRNGDDFNANWQGKAGAPPRVGYTAGLNLLAFPPIDGVIGGYSATVSVVGNMPMPATSGDFLQISRDDYDSVLDEAQHIAMFKIGGQEFLASLPLHAAFLKRAALYNSKLAEMGSYARDILEASRIEDERNPVYTTGQGPKEILGQ